MVDFEKIKPEILTRLNSLCLDKIILFGSYAGGNCTPESDIDLYLVKDDIKEDSFQALSRAARKKLIDLTFKYKIGFDILSSSSDFLFSREDYFYKVDILQNGRVLSE